ncbi:hypothetical protein SEA_FAUST_122 [Streptomyces phage Faust]|uniref:Uncharacterized protein n=1 Tax=Streptomyces phage Faust TaxID=2767565 RepID=A0A7G9UYV8_9CAUD|nr:hypothetical protein PP456_gp146 [Streptomyces phage Faust]QNN99213.1 hypothetical protein SEA_FAUST_122 [Streptomyces phage Faust]
MEDREVIQVDITDTPEPFDEVSEGELETARILRMDPMHLHRILDVHMNVLGAQARARMKARKERLASDGRTVVK